MQQLDLLQEQLCTILAQIKNNCLISKRHNFIFRNGVMPYVNDPNANTNIFFVYVPNDTDTTIGIAWLGTACATGGGLPYRAAIIEYTYPTDVQNAQVF